MSDEILKALRAALKKAGWTILLERPGDDREILGSWKIGREGKGRLFWITYNRQDDLWATPISKKGFPMKDKKDRRLNLGEDRGPDWKAKLADFVASLDD